MHNRSYNAQDAIQRLLLFEEGLSRLIELMKIEKKDVLGNDMDFLCQSIMQDVCRKCPKYRECYGSRQKVTIGENCFDIGAGLPVFWGRRADGILRNSQEM